MREVAEDLGNTPAVARSSYVDPRIVDLYEDGRTLDADLADADPAKPRTRARVERAVLELLTP